MLNGQHINEIIDIFKKINPYLKYENKVERDAVFSLFEIEGYKKTKEAAQYAVKIYDDDDNFVPRIKSPTELTRKLPNLRRYWKDWEAKEKDIISVFGDFREKIVPVNVKNNRKALTQLRGKLKKQGVL